jgi:DNA-binding GntR family transcriptional regulator
VERPVVAPYKHIARVLRARIVDGELQPGDQLQTLTALCDEFGVTRGTASRALGVLQEEGLIYYEPGMGTFVSPPR